MVLPEASPMHTGNQWRLWVPKLLIGYIRSLTQRSFTSFPLKLQLGKASLCGCEVSAQRSASLCCAHTNTKVCVWIKM